MNNSFLSASKKPGRKLLNLGCGSRYHPAWINVDFSPSNAHVLKYNLRKVLPFADNTFDVVYHSHVLEHFSRVAGIMFLKECYRVCRHKGIIRIAVPDFEMTARLYLNFLEQAINCMPGADQFYDWTMLELYDQAVRTKPGGEMALFLRDASSNMKTFIAKRIGRGSFFYDDTDRPKSKSWIPRLFKQPGDIIFQGRRFLTLGLLAIIWGPWGLAQGKEIFFRRQGEIHQWAYDRFSLCRSLELAGFSDPNILGANESSIEEWLSYGLDSEPDGTVYKPDSLFCEAIKH